MTIPSMTKKSFHQPPSDALVKIEITPESTINVARPLTDILQVGGGAAAEMMLRHKLCELNEQNDPTFCLFSSHQNELTVSLNVCVSSCSFALVCVQSGPLVKLKSVVCH